MDILVWYMDLFKDYPERADEHNTKNSLEIAVEDEGTTALIQETSFVQ